MRTLFFAGSAAILLAGCPDKKAPEAAAAERADNAITIDIPADAKAFANKLLKTTVDRFNPTGSSEFTYTEMTFAGDGTWTAKGNLRLGGETIDCVEDGTWRIDSMNGDDAVMDWTLTKTNCPSRDSGTEQRVSMSIDGDNVKISFR
jgi:hypothetical protein